MCVCVLLLKQGIWTELGVAHEQRLGLMDRVASGVLREAETLLGQVRKLPLLRELRLL